MPKCFLVLQHQVVLLLPGKGWVQNFDLSLDGLAFLGSRKSLERREHSSGVLPSRRMPGKACCEGKGFLCAHCPGLRVLELYCFGSLGQLESGRAFVLRSFWAVLGHLLEGLCESDWLPCCAWE